MVSGLHDTIFEKNCKVMFAPIAQVMFCRKGKCDAAPCGCSDEMCSAFHARSAHHLRSIHHARGHITFRGNGTHTSKKRLLSDDKRRFWWCGRWDLNPHVYGWTQAPQACLSTYSSTPASGYFLDAGILYRGLEELSSTFFDPVPCFPRGWRPEECLRNGSGSSRRPRSLCPSCGSSRYRGRSPRGRPRRAPGRPPG